MTPSNDEKRNELLAAIKRGAVVFPNPAIISRVLDLCSRPDTRAHELSEAIQTDAALATKIIRRVNSPYYGMSERIKTITHCVVILGFREIKYLVLGLNAAAMFSSRGAGAAALWQQTLQIACIARSLSYQCKYPIPEQVFVSAIIGKIGAAIMNGHWGKSYADAALPVFLEENLPALETKLFTINHVQIGFILAKIWKFPPELLNAIAYQYNPLPEAGWQLEAALIYVARRATQALYIGDCVETLWETLPPKLIAKLPMTEAIVVDAVTRGLQDFAELKDMFNQ
jgi:HD-like signal output (HDOD) protein